jgi:hypothetical protein
MNQNEGAANKVPVNPNCKVSSTIKQLDSLLDETNTELDNLKMQLGIYLLPERVDESDSKEKNEDSERSSYLVEELLRIQCRVSGIRKRINTLNTHIIN